MFVSLRDIEHLSAEINTSYEKLNKRIAALEDAALCAAKPTPSKETSKSQGKDLTK